MKLQKNNKKEQYCLIMTMEDDNVMSPYYLFKSFGDKEFCDEIIDEIDLVGKKYYSVLISIGIDVAVPLFLNKQRIPLGIDLY